MDSHHTYLCLGRGGGGGGGVSVEYVCLLLVVVVALVGFLDIFLVPISSFSFTLSTAPRAWPSRSLRVGRSLIGFLGRLLY